MSPRDTPGPVRRGDAGTAYNSPIITRTDYEGHHGVQADLLGDQARAGEDGRRFLDFLSGYCVHNTGHNHPAIIEALQWELDRQGPGKHFLCLLGPPQLAIHLPHAHQGQSLLAQQRRLL